jgi:hypothetical protein
LRATIDSGEPARLREAEDDFRRGWKKELTGKEAGPPELTFFEIYKSPIAVIEDLQDVKIRGAGETLPTNCQRTKWPILQPS